MAYNDAKKKTVFGRCRRIFRKGGIASFCINAVDAVFVRMDAVFVVLSVGCGRPGLLHQFVLYSCNSVSNSPRLPNNFPSSFDCCVYYAFPSACT